MKKMYRVLGKRGRITIPYEIRQSVGFCCDDVLSFEQQEHDTVIVRREKICDNCRDVQAGRNDEIVSPEASHWKFGEAKLLEYEKSVREAKEMTLFDFLNSLSEEQQRAAIVHLSANVGKENGRKGGTGNG